jgi:hypothetical protein
MVCGSNSPRLPKDNAIIHLLPEVHSCKGDGFSKSQSAQPEASLDDWAARHHHHSAVTKYLNGPIRYHHSRRQDLLLRPPEIVVANDALHGGLCRVLPWR